MTMEKTEIGELFILNFIQNLVILKASMKENDNKNQNLQSSILNNEFKEPQEQINKIRMVPQFLKPVQVKKQPTPQININQQFKNIQPKLNNYPKESIPSNQNIQNQKSGTEMLMQLIKDPYINEIECIGADNPLLIKKSGIIQKTRVKLTIEEIYDLIAEFSQKTRIPVINGAIKAALYNLIITAALSETLGPRFILQKMRRPQTYI